MLFTYWVVYDLTIQDLKKDLRNPSVGFILQTLNEIYYLNLELSTICSSAQKRKLLKLVTLKMTT